MRTHHVYNPATKQWLDSYNGETRWEWTDKPLGAWLMEQSDAETKAQRIRDSVPNHDSVCILTATESGKTYRKNLAAAKEAATDKMPLLVCLKLTTPEQRALAVSYSVGECFTRSQLGNMGNLAVTEGQQYRGELLCAVALKLPDREGLWKFDGKYLLARTVPHEMIFDWTKTRCVIIASGRGFWARGEDINAAAKNYLTNAGAKRTDRVALWVVLGDATAEINSGGQIIADGGAESVSLGTVVKASALL